MADQLVRYFGNWHNIAMFDRNRSCEKKSTK